ncbi:glycoside hydrolase family 64 protein [Actinoplanes sp. N902-109]|uniref:glycoside hydrolase family 64 protein n=1 Tax=Actinoplanes sp. (strain N902-109) TaxID=649831 RepID=UPI001E2A86D7|nr:glycoside hydrolase family 64 protein [Actinoplanes sp. N902-109]
MAKRAVGKSSPSGAFWDTTGIPTATNVLTVKVLNRTNGRYPDSKVYWSFNGQTHSIAEQPHLDMPANSSGRMYFHLGSPDAALSDFIEFTVGSDQFNGNTTRVDAFVLKLAMRLHSGDGSDLTVGENQATFAESRAATFQRFRAAVPAEFDHLAQGTTRILSPGGDPEFRAGGRFADYFPGDIATSDIFGCAGPLSGKADQCAQLNRATTSNDPGTFYRTAPANFYAKFWHDNAIGHRAYGFPYDDVAAQSTYISHTDPQYLMVAVGY